MQLISRQGHSWGSRGTILLVFTIGMMACSGCAVEKYRQAKQVFNEAASAENGIKLDQAKVIDYSLVEPGKPLSILPSLEMIRTKYENALGLLESITESESAQLEKDGMLADKITLQALCLWRLGRDRDIESLLTAAKKSAARQAQEEAAGRTRDSLILQAMPGLIINDQAHARIPLQPLPKGDKRQFEEVKKALVGPDECALKYIQGARIAASKIHHPVTSYLLQAELAVYRNLMVAYTNFSIPQNPWTTGNVAEYKHANALLRCLERMDTSEHKSVFTTWHQAFGDTKLPDDANCDSAE